MTGQASVSVPRTTHFLGDPQRRYVLWHATVFAQIYAWTVLSRLYKLFKFFARFITGKSELRRLCEPAAQARGSRSDSIPLVDLPPQSRPSSSKDATNESFLAAPRNEHVSGYLVYRVECSLAASTQLIGEWRDMQRFDDDGEQAIESVMRKKGFSTHGGAFTSPASSNFRHCVREIRASYAVVDILQKRAATTFDSGDAQHEKMLLEFWRLAKPNETLRNRISDQWQTIGFQGKDPATDFRGMGLLGLDNLIYYARHHPKSFQRVLEISHHPTAWFSMSIVGINITGFVLELARKGKLQLFFYTFGSSENTFGEVYSYIFDGFAQFWDAQHGITVMDFSRMFKMFQGVVKLDIATMRRPTLLGYTEEEDGGEEKKRL